MTKPSCRASVGRILRAIVCVTVASQCALAQESLGQSQDLSLFDYIRLSGLVGWLILALSVVALAVILENYVSLRREKLAPPELVDEVQSLFDEGQFQQALEVCENDTSFFGRVCAAGIAKIGHDFEVMQHALVERGDEEAIKLHQKISWLTVISAIAPMLGLFGTVQGMILSFQKIATTVNPSPAQLANGIYIALLTTFEGLMVAMPVICAFAYIRNRLIVSLIEVGAIVEDLFERFRPPSPRPDSRLPGRAGG